MSCYYKVKNPWMFSLDLFISLTVCVLLAVLHFGLIPRVRTGFYCDDPNITYPYIGDTISPATLLLGCFLAPLFILWIVESCAVNSSVAKVGRCWNGAKVALLWYREFLLGIVAVLLITECGKLLVGEPRPHFLFTCKPDRGINCSGYISEYKCTNKDVTKFSMDDAQKSFPSGHSATSVFTSVFLVWYLRCRMPIIQCQSWLIIPTVQVFCIFWGMLCSLSRITDHRHHWWDVLAGSVLGVVVAVYLICSPCDNFKMNDRKLNRITRPTTIHEHKNQNHHLSIRRLLSTTPSLTEDRNEKELNNV